MSFLSLILKSYVTNGMLVYVLLSNLNTVSLLKSKNHIFLSKTKRL